MQTINQPQTLTQDFDPDDTAGTWKFTEKVTPEDAQSVLAELMATTSVGKTVLNDGEWQ